MYRILVPCTKVNLGFSFHFSQLKIKRAFKKVKYEPRNFFSSSLPYTIHGQDYFSLMVANQTDFLYYTLHLWNLYKIFSLFKMIHIYWVYNLCKELSKIMKVIYKMNRTFLSLISFKIFEIKVKVSN